MVAGAMWNKKEILGLGRSTQLVVLLFVGLMCDLSLSWRLDIAELSEGETVAIDELREEVKAELTADYMEEDVYLAKWLSAMEFNVSQAAQLLRDNLKWRKEHRIDKILEENWRELEERFPYKRDTLDMEGRPLLYLYFGKWNINKLMTEEDSLVSLGRYLTKIVEESDYQVRKLREGVDGQRISSTPNQFNLIVNFDGYDIWNQGCFQCLAFYRGFGETLERHFPRSVERALLVNVPTPFQVIYWFIEANLAEKTRRSIQLFGEDREIWEPAILSFINKDQVPGSLLSRPLLSDTSEIRPSDDYITA